MNGRRLFQLSSILVAIGLVSAKSLPAEAPKPSEPSEIIDIPSSSIEEDEPSMEVEESLEQDLISSAIAPFVKLQQFFTNIGDRLQEKAIGAGQKMKSTANTLSDAIRDFIIAKLEAQKKKKELKAKLVEEFFKKTSGSTTTSTTEHTTSTNTTTTTTEKSYHYQPKDDDIVNIYRLAPHLIEMDEEQNSIYYRK